MRCTNLDCVRLSKRLHGLTMIGMGVMIEPVTKGGAREASKKWSWPPANTFLRPDYPSLLDTSLPGPDHVACLSLFPLPLSLLSSVSLSLSPFSLFSLPLLSLALSLAH